MANKEFRVRLSCITTLSWSLTCSSKDDVDSILVSPLGLFLTGLVRGIALVDGFAYIGCNERADMFKDEVRERSRLTMAASHSLIRCSRARMDLISISPLSLFSN